jgi:hypothetical protein
MNNILLRNIETHIKELRNARDDPNLYANTLLYFDMCLVSLCLFETIIRTENYPSDWEEGSNV